MPRHSAAAAALRTSLGAGRTVAHLGPLGHFLDRTEPNTPPAGKPPPPPPNSAGPLPLSLACPHTMWHDCAGALGGGRCLQRNSPRPLVFFFDVTVGGILMQPPTHPHPCGATARPPCPLPFHTVHDTLGRACRCVYPLSGCRGHRWRTAGHGSWRVGVASASGDRALVSRRGAPDGGRVHRGLAVSSTFTTGTHAVDSRALVTALPAPQPAALLCVASAC